MNFRIKKNKSCGFTIKPPKKYLNYLLSEGYAFDDPIGIIFEVSTIHRAGEQCKKVRVAMSDFNDSDHYVEMDQWVIDYLELESTNRNTEVRLRHIRPRYADHICIQPLEKIQADDIESFRVNLETILSGSVKVANRGQLVRGEQSFIIADIIKNSVSTSFAVMINCEVSVDILLSVAETEEQAKLKLEAETRAKAEEEKEKQRKKEMDGFAIPHPPPSLSESSVAIPRTQTQTRSRALPLPISKFNKQNTIPDEGGHRLGGNISRQQWLDRFCKK